MVRHSVTDFTAGTFEHTGNPLDLALSGDGLFAVQTANGERYTRDGSFTRDAQGFLATQNGDRVLGEAGPLQIRGGQVTVQEDGTVLVDGQSAGRLRVVRFAKGAGLEKEGANLFRATRAGQVVTANAGVQQGEIEHSNVNTVREMIAMIDSMRTYETNQRLITTQDELLQKAVQEVGRV